MTTLPVKDLGLMAEHLSIHEGVTNKHSLYEVKIINATLKEAFILQSNGIHNHVGLMLALINPHQNGYIEFLHLNEYR